jgi:hypothetical protein
MNHREKAMSLGATEFGESKRANKRYYVKYNGKTINFGDPNAISTYSDGADEKKRDAYRARHSKIKLKDGSYAFKNKSSPSYWSYNVLW